MKTMKIMVAVMAMIISTAAFNTVSAQGRHDRGNGRHETHQNGGHRDANVGHSGNKGGHGVGSHNGRPSGNHGGVHADTRHHNNGRHDFHYDAHHNNHGGYHFDAHRVHHSHMGHAIAYNRPVCHYYNDMPIYVRHYYHHTAPVVVRHWGYGYVPVAGDIVDCLPDNYISVNIDGVHLFRALGHIFRPISIDGALRFIIE